MRDRVAVAISILEKHGYVTNRMFGEVGLIHTGRNAVSEAKAHFLAKGFKIEFKGSKDFMENRWSLVPVCPETLPIHVEHGGQRAFA